jgi:diamine N-acetyltransferase
MHPVVTLSAAGADEIPLVQALADEVWRRHYPGILSTAQIDYMLERNYARAELMRYIVDSDAGLALARIDEQPVGFVAWYRDGASTVKLDRLYVLAQHQGTGIGRSLIEHVVGEAQRTGCSSITLNVNRYNTSSIRAYEHCGFAIREQGDFPIGNGFVMEDFVMVRDL